MLAAASLRGENGSAEPVFNLACAPKNRLVHRLMEKRYSLRTVTKLEEDLMKLGYGKQLSLRIRR